MNLVPHFARRPLGPALCVTGLLVACASQGPVADDDLVDVLVQRGQYQEAVREAKKRCDAAPDDQRAREIWRLASVALLLDAGRRLSFQDRDLEALAKFDEARAIGGDVPEVEQWRKATMAKLTDQWIQKAYEFHNSDDLAEASNCYEQALAYSPDDPRAKEGLARVLVQLNFRRGMGEKYYVEGIEALDEYFLEQASHHFGATGKYDDDNERAKRRRRETDTLRADERVIKAIDLEDQGNFAAARNEYRLATLFDPEHAEARAGLERAKLEERAAERMRECERRILRRQFDLAEKALDEGLALTVRQKEAFEAEKERLANARLMVKYEYARALEVDHRYEDAISAYTEVIESSAQGFFEDALARRDALQDTLVRAAQYYERAVAAATPEEQLALLKQVLIVYPDYKDARVRAQALEAAHTPPAGEQPQR